MESSRLKIAFTKFIEASQSNHKSIQEYGTYIKNAAQEIEDIGSEYKLDDWMLRATFVCGLSFEYEMYLLRFEQMAKTPLPLDDMIWILVEYEERIKHRKREEKGRTQRNRKKGKKNRRV